MSNGKKNLILLSQYWKKSNITITILEKKGQFGLFSIAPPLVIALPTLR